MLSSDIPDHVAIIPDGNRRWAKNHKLSTMKGHEAGFENLRSLLKNCKDSGPKILSFYAFSTENFKRSQTEINNLFTILERVLDSFTQELLDNNIQLRVSGSSERITPALYKKIEVATKKCCNGNFILNICFNYGSQEELVQVLRKTVQKYQKKTICLEDITVDFVQSELWNSDLKPVDLLIRSGGEYRISNFMLWQSAYAELYFSDKLWPDFSGTDFEAALKEYKCRHRKFGK